MHSDVVGATDDRVTYIGDKLSHQDIKKIDFSVFHVCVGLL